MNLLVTYYQFVEAFDVVNLVHKIYMVEQLHFLRFTFLESVNFRDAAFSTNIGKLLERRGNEFLGPTYKDPVTSFSHFQEFSVSNPEVCLIRY